MSHANRSVLKKLAVAATLFAATLGACRYACAQSAAGVNTVPAATPTLWQFLGIPQGVHKVHDTLVNRCGRLPGLERKPPLLRIADPRLAEIDNAAIKKAQQIKAEEDLAPQKIKAIKYLASLGCEKCYGGIEEAMLESLKDCTEEVRYETVKALGKIPNQKCPDCDNDCCSQKITEQLAKIAYERDPDQPDCWLEPSARVRRAAIETLPVCCSNQQPPADAMSPAESPAPSRVPIEGGRDETPVEPGPRSARAPAAIALRGPEQSHDLAMELHIAPRRSEPAGDAPDPREERSVVVTSFHDDVERLGAESVDGQRLGGEVRQAAFVEAATSDFDAPSPRPAASRRLATVRTSPPPELNPYGRRYVTWGTPHGDYAPPARQSPRNVARRGLLD